MRRVVVTGVGMVAPTGVCASDAWNAALSAKSAVGKISQIDASELPVQIAAEVTGFDPIQFMSAKHARQSSRFVQFALGAVHEAVTDSAFDLSKDPERHGCSIGVGMGAFGDIEQQAIALQDSGPRRVSPLLVPYTTTGMAAGVASITHNLRGPNLCISTACASGNHAIGEAFLHVTVGSADVMIAGGAEASISPLAVAAFGRMNALSTQQGHPSRASRPFDRDRDGFVIGEGSGMLVLEEYEHARCRGAKIYAEMVGYGMTGDAYHITTPAPEGDGAARCMAGAVKASGIAPEDVDYINAHGTSTQLNDATESAAIETVFGERAQELSVSSTKGVTGHCLGAAGAIEAVYTVLAVHHGIVPPTANYENADPECRLDYTPREPRERTIRYALNNSFGFGGQNSCTAFKRFD